MVRVGAGDWAAALLFAEAFRVMRLSGTAGGWYSWMFRVSDVVGGGKTIWVKPC